MDVVFLSPAHPFRGGIAQFSQMWARALQAAGHRVRILTFGTLGAVLPFLVVKIGLEVLQFRTDVTRLGAVPLVMIPVSFGYCVARYQVLQIDFLVKRSLLYSVLSGLLLVIWAALVFWLGGFSSDPSYPISGPGGPSYAVQTPSRAHQEDPIEQRPWLLDVDVALTGTEGIERARDLDPDVIVLDMRLPDMSGLELTRMLKRDNEHEDLAVIMLTARGDDIDRILGLEIGADDYVPKPCNLRELVARIRAILRRSNRAETAGSDSQEIVIGDMKMEPGSQSVFCTGELVPLTGAEYLVLEALVNSVGQVVDNDAIARHALGRRIMPYDRSVDAHVSNLRKKLGPLRDGRQRIKTVRGRGYLYVTSEV